LEVGTGFHAELSGRENIFLNGSILGMSKSEIKNKFDEIVAFAEIEKFLDTPVKRYSSGMYVRLAFAVAAHLDPEILIVDEVLAVGDAEFQRKCLGKMKDVSGEGRTVLFVSHNMGQISALCSKSIILNKGKIEYHGAVNEALKIYHNIQSKEAVQHYIAQGKNKEIYISEALIKNKENENVQTFTHDEAVYIFFKFNADYVVEDLLLSISVSDKNDIKIFSTERTISKVLSVNKKQGEAILKIPDNFLLPGEYKVKAGIHIPNVQEFDSIENICSFSIVDNGSEFAKYEGVNLGYVFSKCEWEIR
jgi:lipopolysaccharide transport system ATP-binding protein